MKKSSIRAALLRGLVCLTALALVLPGAVFAADHGGHSGWTEMQQLAAPWRSLLTG